jgi:transposase-like protein
MRSTEATSTLAPIRRRRRFSKEFKHQVVEETLIRGASVAAIALRHRLNANQVFNWRRKHLREAALLPAKAVKMLQVTIEAPSVPLPVRGPSQNSTRALRVLCRAARSGSSMRVQRSACAAWWMPMRYASPSKCSVREIALPQARACGSPLG